MAGKDVYDVIGVGALGSGVPAVKKSPNLGGLGG